MSQFISAAQATEGNFYNQRQILDELAQMEFTIRRAMDAGLTPQDMTVAVSIREAIEAAKEIVNQI